MSLPLWKKTKNEGKVKPENKHYSFFAILLSVLTALVLWFYVQDAESPDYKKTFPSIPVQIQSLSSGFSIIGVDELTVDITLVGKRGDLNKIKARDLETYVDLSSINRAGTYYLDVNVLVPEGTELADCFPRVAALYVDHTVSVSVPVKVDLGAYTVGENTVLKAIPAVNEILIKGPKTILDTIDCAKVSTGNLGNLTADFESNLEYQLIDKSGNPVLSQHIPLSVRNVRVVFQLLKTKQVPLTVEGKNHLWAENQIQYTVNPAQVLIQGAPSLIDSITSVPALVVDERYLDDNQWKVTLLPDQLALPNGVSLAETLNQVEVQLNLTDNHSRVMWMPLNSTRVAVTPPRGEDLTYQFLSSNLEFKIRGGALSLQEANINHFYFNIDLSSIASAGEYEVPVQVGQTGGLDQYYLVGDYSVKVIVQ